MSLCGMPYEEGDDFSTFWREKKVKARGVHHCCECGATIQPGEVYGRAEAVYDGQWESWNRCPACLILAEMAATLIGECALWGGLAEQIENINGEIRRGWVEGATEPLCSPREHRRRWEGLPDPPETKG